MLAHAPGMHLGPLQCGHVLCSFPSRQRFSTVFTHSILGHTISMHPHGGGTLLTIQACVLCPSACCTHLRKDTARAYHENSASTCRERKRPDGARDARVGITLKRDLPRRSPLFPTIDCSRTTFPPL